MANRLEPALASSSIHLIQDNEVEIRIFITDRYGGSPTSSQVIEDSTVHRSKSVRSVSAEEFPKILHQVYILQLFRDILNYKMML